MRRLAWLLLLASCDDDSAKASGVDSSALIVDLDEPRLKQICRWLSDRDYAYDKTRDCHAIAVQASWEGDLDRAGCERERELCEERVSAEREPRRADQLMRCETMMLAKPRAYCSSTVGELERCVRDTLQHTWAYAAQFSCADIERQVLEPDYYPPESCDDVELSCYPAGGLED